jgi:transposase
VSMNTLILTRKQIQQKRYEAAALFEQDLSNAEIGRRIGINRSSVSGWKQIWQAHGNEGLLLHTPGPASRLTDQQVQQVLQALLQGPEAQGFPTPLWTLQRIAQLIEKETGVHYNSNYVAELLHDWDWSAQKPEPAAKERDEAEIERWKTEEWPRIKKGAEKRAAKIAFLDESGFSQKPSVRRTWAPRGQTPYLKIHFNWKRLNVIGSLVCNPDGSKADLLLDFQPKSIKEDAVLGYLQALHKQVKGPIVLLWDHLSAHCSAKVAAYLSANADWLTVEWFPGYAPELNPIEYVWSHAKGDPTANSSPDTLADIEHSLLGMRKQLVNDQEVMYGFLEASELFPEK